MGKIYAEIDERIAAWISRQRLFFVASAPSGDEGLVNCSPKGYETLAITGPRELAYLDLGGSGIETVAHMRQNGRIVIMLCAFEGPPKIMRFHGHGTVLEPGDAEFDGLLAKFPEPPSVARSIIRVAVTRISDSCGYGVPEYAYTRQRDALTNWVSDKTPAQLDAYMNENNAASLDGLPGLAKKR